MTNAFLLKFSHPLCAVVKKKKKKTNSFLCGRDEIPRHRKSLLRWLSVSTAASTGTKVNQQISLCSWRRPDLSFLLARDARLWVFFCSVECEDRGNNHYWEKTCVCDVTSKGHDTKTLLLLLIIHICASEDFAEDLSSELLGFGFIFGLSFFFLFTAGHLAHKSCLFCRLLSSLRQQVFCQSEAPALSLLQQQWLFSEPGQSGAQAKRAIQLAA